MRRLLLIASLCFWQSIWAAQDAASQPNGDEATAEEQADSDPLSQQEAASEEELILAEIDEVEEEDSAGRFIPTEQISQDLGVSFPVDI